jgi:hypothetical protein
MGGIRGKTLARFMCIPMCNTVLIVANRGFSVGSCNSGGTIAGPIVAGTSSIAVVPGLIVAGLAISMLSVSMQLGLIRVNSGVSLIQKRAVMRSNSLIVMALTDMGTSWGVIFATIGMGVLRAIIVFTRCSLSVSIVGLAVVSGRSRVSVAALSVVVPSIQAGLVIAVTWIGAGLVMMPVALELVQEGRHIDIIS